MNIHPPPPPPINALATALIVLQFSNIKHATSTAGYTVNEIGGSAREIVLDIVSEFGCRNDNGGIYKLTSFTLSHSAGKSTNYW